MKNLRIRILAVFLGALTALSPAAPAITAGGAELSGSSVISEQESVSSEEDTGTEEETDPAEMAESAEGTDPAESPVPEEIGDSGAMTEEALEAVPAGPGTVLCTVTIKESEGGRMIFAGEPEECTGKQFPRGASVTLCTIPEEGYRADEVLVRYPDGSEEKAEYREEENIWEFILREDGAEAEAVFTGTDGNPEQEDPEREAPELTGEGPEVESGEADGPGSADAGAPEEKERTDEETDEEGKDDEEEEEEKKDAEPAASTRLLVKTEDAGALDADAVIGVMDDVYLLQFGSEEEAGEALADYRENAEFAAEDIPVMAAAYGEFPVAEGTPERTMTETDNPFSEAVPAAPVAASRPLIALIDTGVSWAKEISGRYSVLGDDGYDGNGHGDAMLDTIRGFDPKAEIVSIKALDDAGMGTVSSLYAAIRMAIDMQVSVINLSLSAYSTEGNEAVASIIREAAASGIIVVGAAGNNGADAGSYIPANIPEAVIAAACNKEGARLPSSNYGSAVDLFILAGSSSYAAATLSGIISATGGVPGPDGMAVYAPSGTTAPDDYVDGLCYDGMSGNFQTAGVTYTIHNAGGKRLSDLIPGLTYESLKAWLGSHENDDYYLGTPYPEQVVNGVPQYILGRSGDCDNRNPNGDCGEIHGNDDYAGVAMMNCTGFVWHALWKASGLSYTDGLNRIPAWGGIGAGAWKNFIQNNGLEYMTVKSGGTNEINDMLSTAMWSARDAEGNIFLEKGDIIWFWVDQIPLGSDDLPVNGYFGGLSDKAHVGIFWPADGGNDNRWWDSLGICEYQGEGGYYLRNMLHQFTPKTGSVAMTIIKLGHNNKPKLTKINIQKTSRNKEMTDNNGCYSLQGAKYGVYKTREDAANAGSPAAVITTDETGYGESEEVLEIGKTYYIRETEAPANGSFLLDQTIYTVKTREPDQVTKETALQTAEVPANDPAAIAIEKITSDGIPAKETKPLSGAQFTIRYYKGEYTKLSGLPRPDKTWVLETKKQSDGTYSAFLLPDYKISGDDFYYLSGNPDPVLPLGTITIEETKAPEGYQLENKYKNGSTSGSGVYLAVIRKKGDAVCLTYGNTVIKENGFTASDTPVRGGVKIQKLDADMKLDMDGTPYAEGDKTLAGAEFVITSRNDYTVKNKDGNTVSKGGTMQTITTDATGLAKTGGKDLPYGTYEIHETKPSTGYKLNSGWKKTFSVKEDGKIVELTGEADACYEPDIKGGVKVQKLDADIKLLMDGKPYAEGDKSLAGAEFTITNRSAHAVKNKEGKIVETGGAVQVIKTDANGIAATGSTDLPYGTYEITETKPSAGYKLNSTWKKSFTVRKDGEVTAFTSEADACYEPDIKGGVRIQKTDRELKKAEAIGAASLGGITYQIINSSAHAAINKDGRIIKPGAVMQEIKTDKAGIAKTGGTDLPYGTYTLHEITVDDLELSANDSYLQKGAEDVIFRIREDGKIVTLDKDGKDITFVNQVKRNDLAFRKVEDGTDRPMGSIPFVIENAATGEKHVIVTDANGMFSSTKYAHSRDTNANDRLLEGYTEKTVLKSADLSYKSGTWFGMGQEGSMAEVNDALPAFPYGSYTITELRCEANEGYELIRNYPFVIDEDISETGGEPRQLNNLKNIPVLPVIRTTALDDKTGDHIMLAEEDAHLTDIVRAENLQKGTAYILAATLMEEETGNALRIPDEENTKSKVTGEVTFTAEAGTMEIEVPVALNAKSLAGKKIVVFEQLFIKEKDESRTPVAEHREITDKEQTITIPEVHTTFSDVQSGSQTGKLSEEQKVSDTVRYTGLIPGKEYSVTAAVMTADEKGEPVPLKDKDGNPVTNTMTFTPEKSEGSVTVECVIDSSLLAGKKAVCFEEIRSGEIPVAVHADINDEDQTIRYPEIRTTATDKETGEHVATVTEKGVFIDVISYTGLKPGVTYTAKAQLMDAGSGEPVKEKGKEVTAVTTFTPDTESGEISVEIPVNTKEIAGRKTVVFEELFVEGGADSTDKEGDTVEAQGKTPVAEHKDLTDEDQQISIPEIRTTFTDGRTGSHSAESGRKVELTDTVAYTGLLPGKKYRLEAVLMTVDDSGKETEVKDGDGKPVTAEKTFTAKAADGEEKVTFTVDTSRITGKKAVCFETLYLDNIRLAVHADIDDADQTVLIPSIRTQARDAVSGLQIASEGSTSFVDTVRYSGLTPGAAYVIRGTLMNAETGKALPAGFFRKTGGETHFVPETPDGTVEVTFSVDTKKFAGVTAVVFEELYRKTESGKEIPSAEHKDLSDTDQQIRIPEIRTTAETEDGKESAASKRLKLTDTVSYRSLLPGETYILKGKVVDRASGRTISINGKPIAAQKRFTASSGDGTEELTFTFDATRLGGRTLVVFEELYVTNEAGEEVKIASHADPEDEAQSVKVTPGEVTKTPTKTVTPGPSQSAGQPGAGRTGVSVPKTGDTGKAGFYAGLLIAAALAGICLYSVKRRRSSHERQNRR